MNRILLNTDYIFFLYGIVLILFLKGLFNVPGDTKKKLYLNYLIFFACGLCINQWLEIIHTPFPDKLWLKTLSLITFVFPFISLFIFSARQLTARWKNVVSVYAFLLCIAAVAISFKYSIDRVQILLNYTLAFPVSVSIFALIIKDKMPVIKNGNRRITTPLLFILLYSLTWLIPVYLFSDNSSFGLLYGKPFLLKTIMTLIQVIALSVTGVWFFYRREERERKQASLFSRYFSPAGLVIILAVGWCVTEWRAGSVDRNLRSMILRQANSVANAIKPEVVLKLAFTADDISNPHFQSIRSQMISYGNFCGAKSIYSMRLIGGELYFGPENIPEKDPMASPPGTLYIKPHPDFITAFREIRAGVIGPYTDEYGTFVSGYAPVIDARTGKVLMLACIDIDAARWISGIASARLLVIAAVLFVFLFFCSVDILLTIRDDKWKNRTGFIYRQMETVFIFIAGIILTMMVVLIFYYIETKKERDSFIQFADSTAGVIKETLLNINYDLDGLAKFFKNSENVTLNEFRLFTSEMKYSFISVRGWFPLIRRDERASFEAMLRRNGSGTYGIYMSSQDGKNIPSPPADIYYPLKYVDPVYHGKKVPGFDLFSDERWRLPAEKSVKTGSADFVKSGVLSLDNSERKMITIIIPVLKTVDRKDKVAGFVVSSTDLQFALSNAMAFNKNSLIAIHADIIDITSEKHEILAEYLTGDHREDGFHRRINKLKPDSISDYPVFIFGRVLVIRIYHNQNYLNDNMYLSALMGGISAFMLTIAVVLFTGFMRIREFKLESEVALRTKDLSESEERFRTLYQASFGGIAIHDKGVIIECNHGLAVMTGYTIEELTGMNGLLLIATESRDFVMKNIMAGVTEQYDALGIKKDGTIYPVEIQGKNIPYHGKNVRVTEFRDIKERKKTETILNQQRSELEAINEEMQAEMEEFEAMNSELIDMNQQLIESEEKFSRAFSINPAVMSISSIETGQFIEVNEAFLRTFRYNREDVIGKTALEIDFYADHAERDLVFDFISTDGFLRNFEVELKTSAGERRQGLLSADYITIHDVKYMITVITDITERKKMEEELKSSEQRYKLLFETAVDGILLLEDYRFTDCNSKAEELYGCKRDYIIGQTPGKFSPEYQPDGSASQTKAMAKINAACNGEPQFFEWTHCKYDGTLFDAEVSLNSFDFEGRKIIIAIVRDVSERKKFELRLAHMQKMDAIGQLAGGVAHDFNNQLSGILGYAEILSMKLSDSGLKKYADGIMSVALRSADLTKKLLAFARKGQFQLVQVSIHPLIDETIEILMHSIDKRINIVKKYNALSDAVTGDPAQLQNALLNLGLNARDAMQEGGILTYETEEIYLEKDLHKVQIMDVCEGNYIVISITDTGTGMSESVKAHLFEPFFTTKESGKGTGMGLASVYGTVKNHNGTISVYSEQGRGTTFRIYLPLTGGSGESAYRTYADEDLDIPMQRILIVDDEDVVRGVLSEMLRDMGHTVYEAVNGEEGVLVYNEKWSDTDIVIIDMIMPEMNGHDAFLAMKKINPGIKAILSSGFSLDGESQLMMSEGVKGFIHKPYRKRELLKMIKEAIVENKTV